MTERTGQKRLFLTTSIQFSWESWMEFCYKHRKISRVEYLWADQHEPQPQTQKRKTNQIRQLVVLDQFSPLFCSHLHAETRPALISWEIAAFCALGGTAGLKLTDGCEPEDSRTDSAAVASRSRQRQERWGKVNMKSRVCDRFIWTHHLQLRWPGRFSWCWMK